MESFLMVTKTSSTRTIRTRVAAQTRMTAPLAEDRGMIAAAVRILNQSLKAARRRVGKEESPLLLPMKIPRRNLAKSPVKMTSSGSGMRVQTSRIRNRKSAAKITKKKRIERDVGTALIQIATDVI